MHVPFIRNHQYNFIKKQAESLQQALRTIADPKIVESVRYSAETKISELFPDAADEQKRMLGQIAGLNTSEDFHRYLEALKPYRMEFPSITAKQIQKLFPKNKKLKLPDLSAIDYRQVSYLSWTDIATQKLFMVYPMNGQFVGIEGRYTDTNKKGFCFVCNKYEELVLFSAVSRKRPVHSSADYYKAVGNYVCAHSQECNKNITDMTALEHFVDTVIG
ncbi:FBP C-terminal treble-clef zinc-finger [Paenibacillus sp. UNCCL117]|uniref:FusB/FusC family EF-G-binding protein n=1 Tax=unclassified Paenibacillus TaxID=185978 RepID=UPI0008854D4C|nr:MULTISPECIES: FusB/FusC family EF-G-binding protein [unclassified Paenibacillus]SDC54712.1 FBP C-terminal treble-clef zinc-finger [Paenibacillus sp. cl123]SFW11017.1 FBP C-terminal treble-clef zinc-finger [Paenibacillus sp. UNCCL117]